MKKNATRIGIILVLVLLIAGAATLGAQGQKGEAEGPITLTVWNFKYAEEIGGKAFREMDRLFMEQNPGIIIDHQAQPESNYYQLLISAFSAKSDLDVFLTHTDQRAWGISESYYLLDDQIKDVMDTYADSALEACSETKSKDSGIKILPLTAQGNGFYYNKTLLKQAGLDPEVVPSDWNTFLNACEKLKNAGITPIIYGNQGSPFGICFTYRTILGTLLSSDEIDGFTDGSTTFKRDEYVQATRMIKELFDKGYVNVENSSIPYFMDGITDFQAGKGAFFCGLNSDIAHWKDFGTALGYENVGYFSAPVASNAKYPLAQVNQGAGIGFAVADHSPHKEAAAKYVKFMTSGEAGKVFMDATGAIVPNSTIPVDASNPMLTDILEKMNSHATPDIMNRVPGGMITDYYNFMTLYFISGEISESRYIDQVEAIYRSNL
ncbi:MAG: extracellular solute-binding protein [Eubacteriales bacterium]|jgi:ABC-type glycerol-3-phosphate transport system substrate-binding protein|nr:extracellular solute-binding protein [Eubacteriales bacterium]MDD3823016.1 extracellular solute-binding protein [Sphaerochaetaceae bacterium]MDD3942690.1 extracellular solute-binding protein [Sphaerochaetaceae bacterium]MDX9939730.1 extracellular solute-binding protein [Sphaerochaetaceae bacterium]